MAMIMLKFDPQKVMDMRKQQKMTRDQLAKKCGVSESAIKRIEHGERDPRADTLARLAYGLGTKRISAFFVEREEGVLD